MWLKSITMPHRVPASRSVSACARVDVAAQSVEVQRLGPQTRRRGARARSAAAVEFAGDPVEVLVEGSRPGAWSSAPQGSTSAWAPVAAASASSMSR